MSVVSLEKQTLPTFDLLTEKERFHKLIRYERHCPRQQNECCVSWFEVNAVDMTIHWWCVTIIKCQLVRALFSKSLSFQLRKLREGTPPPFTPRSLQDSNQGHLVTTEELLESELRAYLSFSFKWLITKHLLLYFGWVAQQKTNKQRTQQDLNP